VGVVVRGTGAGVGCGHAQPVAVVVVGVGLGLRVAAAGLGLLGDEVGQALVGEVGGAIVAGTGVVLGLPGGTVQRVVDVAGLVGLGTTGVLGLRGEPVEVVVTVVDEQVGARGAGVAVGLAAGRGGDAVGVALLVVPVLGGGPSDSDVGDLVPGVALRGGGSVV